MIDRDELKITLAKVQADDPTFFSRIFTQLCKEKKKKFSKDDVGRICGEEYDSLSRRADRSGIQESCSIRNILRTREIVNFLIDDKGSFSSEKVTEVIDQLKKNLYSLGPNRQHDGKRQEQILHVLEKLQEGKKLGVLLKKISKPYQHEIAEKIIRETLQLPDNAVVTDAHARRAALSAWMCYLRQNVGSCFATAPAIIVHDEQPELFLSDINELLGTGQLKRTFGGVEHSVPLSPSWGAGDLKRPFFVQFQSELWLSPGLLSAFEKAELISPKISLKEKVEKAKALLTQAIEDLGKVTATSEELIYKVLMQQLSVTEQDVDDFKKRPRGMVHDSLLLQIPKREAKGSVQKCAHFFVQFEKAKNAYKALSDNALLKTWEFTVASFAETKPQFTRWNLYASLGFNSSDKGGIGACLYEILNRKLEEANQKVHEIQGEYEQVYTQVKFLENRFQRASSEQEAKWMRAEYQSKVNEFRTLEEIRNKAHYKAKRYANFFPVLVDLYDQVFPKYFQEIYDADIHEISAGPYDDSPAGFRLLYKHGRRNTASWTLIRDHHEFIDALASFFVTSETEIAASPEMEGLEEDFSEIVTAIVIHVKTPEFLETAFCRMAVAHNARVVEKPLENLDKIEKKPWVYTSGGTMGSLVSNYFGREEKPTEVSRWVESPSELLVFLIDTMKQNREPVTSQFVENTNRSMLIHSPTHAFLFKPGFHFIKESWQKKTYTYTWVRDRYVIPRKKFIQRHLLDKEKMEFLIKQIKETLPEELRGSFEHACSGFYGRKTAPEFRNIVLGMIAKNSRLQAVSRYVLSPDEIDSILYASFPLSYGYQLQERIEKIFSYLPGIAQSELKNTLELVLRPISKEALIAAQKLQDICKAVVCLMINDTSSCYNYPLMISEAAQSLGYALPTPIIFADTNWVKDFFAFVVSPGTGNLELWRVDETGSIGAPMSIWHHWLDGSRKDRSWGIYTQPTEYKGFLRKTGPHFLL